jgi:FixJ family two-component response regulator
MNGETPTVFIVDDEESVRSGLGRLMRSAGWEAELFGDAREFLERLPVERAGCLVLDVSMPGIRGPELHDHLMERGFTLPTIFLTGHGDVPTSVEEMKKGAIDFLLKPVDEEILLKTVAYAIDHYNSTREEVASRAEIMERLNSLTPRERDVLECVIGGFLNKQTADMLGIVEKTVKVHRARIMEKMGVRSVAELVYRCDRAGVQPQHRR